MKKLLLLLMMMKSRTDVAGADQTDPGPRSSTRAPPPPTGASLLWTGNGPPNIQCSIIQLFLESKMTVRNANEPLAWSGQLARLARCSRLAGTMLMLALACY